MAARALLFDVDGTLWDSFPWYSEVLAGLSGQAREEILERLRAGSSIVTLAKRGGVTDGQLRSSCRRCVDRLRLYPGVRESLAEIERRGTLCGIVTSLPERIVVPILDAVGLTGHFPVIVTAGTVRRGKPHPDGLEYALHKLGADAASAYYIGDSAMDALAAQRASVPFAWAAYGYGTSCPATGAVVLGDFREVLQL